MRTTIFGFLLFAETLMYQMVLERLKVPFFSLYLQPFGDFNSYRTSMNETKCNWNAIHVRFTAWNLSSMLSVNERLVFNLIQFSQQGGYF